MCRLGSGIEAGNAVEPGRAQGVDIGLRDAFVLPLPALTEVVARIDCTVVNPREDEAARGLPEECVDVEFWKGPPEDSPLFHVVVAFEGENSFGGGDEEPPR